MKAIVYTQYGSPDVLHLAEVAKPTPKEDEVLVKVFAASVNAAESHVVRADPPIMRLMGYGVLKPNKTIPGAAMAGRVESVGSKVKQFKPGDEVFGDLSFSGLGAFAEYVCAPESALALKPVNATFEEAAAIPLAATTALQALRDKGHIQSGQKVLINGASGGVGTFAVQIARAFGAEVTAVCSTGKLDMVRSIGADHVIDYTREDFTRNGQSYDLIVSANGYHPIADYRRVLSPNGTYVMSGGAAMAAMMEAMILGPWISMRGTKKMVNVLGKPSQQDLVFLKGLVEAGKVKPVIDRCYPLSQVPDALRCLEEGHARGKIVITVAA